MNLLYYISLPSKEKEDVATGCYERSYAFIFSLPINPVKKKLSYEREQFT